MQHTQMSVNRPVDNLNNILDFKYILIPKVRLTCKG